MSSLSYVAPVFVVRDLERSLPYYRDRMGFAIDFVYEGAYASVVRDGCHIHLKSGTAEVRESSFAGDADHIDACFSVLKVSALACEFEVAGVTFSVPLRQMPYGHEFYVRDPDGYTLAFVQAPG